MLKTAYVFGMTKALNDLGIKTATPNSFGDVTTPILGALPGSFLLNSAISGLTAPEGQRAATALSTGTGQALGGLVGVGAGTGLGMGGAALYDKLFNKTLIDKLLQRRFGTVDPDHLAAGGVYGALGGGALGSGIGAHYGRSIGKEY